MSGPSRATFAFLALAVVAGAFFTGGDLLVVLNVPGLAVVTAVLCLGLCATFGPGVVFEAAGDLLRRDATRRERELHVRVWRRAQTLAWASGVATSACGVFLLLAHVEEPEHVLPSCGTCLLPLFWAGLYAELLFDWCERLVERRLDEGAAPPARRVSGAGE